MKQLLCPREVFLLAVLLLNSFLLVTCSKKADDRSPAEGLLLTKFLSSEVIGDPDVQNIANQIMQKNEKEHFLSSFITNNGYILWNDAQKASSKKGRIIILPFAFENAREVNGFIIARL